MLKFKEFLTEGKDAPHIVIFHPEGGRVGLDDVDSVVKLFKNKKDAQRFIFNQLVDVLEGELPHDEALKEAKKQMLAEDGEAWDMLQEYCFMYEAEFEDPNKIK